MTLADIRERLVKDSGRTDLVVDTTTYDDDGADYYIKAGQRFLDDFPMASPKSAAEIEFDIVSGDAGITFPRVRAVLDLRIQESGKEPAIMDRVPLMKFYRKYGDLNYLQNQASVGKPTRYTLGILRDSQGATSAELNRTILFHPPADGAYTLVLTSEYFSASLQSDGDESWWSLVYPEVLVLAARRELEVAHRNNQGVEEFTRRIRSRLSGIDSNVAEELTSNSGKMTNAW